MDKPAPVDYPVHELISSRWSPRAFDDRNVPALEICSLLEAARWAASCFNEQPWRFIVGTKAQGEPYEKILSTLIQFNRSWAKAAPVLMLGVANKNFEHNGKTNAHAIYDLGQAVSSMMIEATARGLVAHQMAGFDAKKAAEIFEVPKDHKVIVAIAIGYPGEVSTLSDKLAEREQASRERKPLSEIVFGTRFGEEAPLVD